MDLVDEKDRPLAELARLFGRRHHVLDFADSGEHRAELDEMATRLARDDHGQRRFARARRTPEDRRRKLVALDRPPQRLPWSEEVELTHELVQRIRTHPVRQRSAFRFHGGRRRWLKQAHEKLKPRWRAAS